MTPEEKEILVKYNQIKGKLGHQPSYADFLKESKKTLRDLQRIFGRNSYSKLVEKAGDQPKEFFHKGKTEEELLVIWGNWVRKLDHVPNEPDWEYHNIRPTADWYRRKFNGIPNIQIRFRNRFKDSPEWLDVINIISTELPRKEEVNDPFDINSIEDDTIVIPYLIDMEKYSQEEGNSLKFESYVSKALQLLGLVVKPLGQGTGRNPDGLAFSIKSHIGLIYDAKARKERYNFGTDDRTFNEYISNNKKYFVEKGIHNPFFLVISSDFSKITDNMIKRVTIPMYFLTAKQLSDLIRVRIQYSDFFGIDDFANFLSNQNGPGKIDDKIINGFIDEIKNKYEKALM
jgi:hypothetical protein